MKLNGKSRPRTLDCGDQVLIMVASRAIPFGTAQELNNTAYDRFGKAVA
jgi:hypothetical protein